MKRIIAICVLFLSLSTLFCFNAYATESEVKGSLDIDSSILKEIGVREGEIAIRLYHPEVVSAYSRYDTVEQMISNVSQGPPSYFILTKDVLARYTITRGAGTSLGSDKLETYEVKDPYGYASKRYSFVCTEILSNYALKKISPDIEVLNAYVLCSNYKIVYNFATIYYKTNMGTFVYSVYTWGDTYEFIMPLETFSELMKVLYTGEDRFGAPNYNISSVYDVSKYDIHSSLFSPLSPLVRKDGAPTNTSETNTTEATNPTVETTNPTVETTMPTTPQTAGDSNSAKIYLWVGIPCIAVLGTIGVVFAVKKKRKKE